MAKPKRTLGYTDARQVRLMFEEMGEAMCAASASEGGYSLAELLAAGVDVPSLRLAGFAVSDLRPHGFSVSALCDAGFAPSAFGSASGFAVLDLVAAGFKEPQLREAGFAQKDIDVALKPPKSKGPAKKGKGRK